MQVESPKIPLVAVPLDLSEVALASYDRQLAEILDSGPKTIEIDTSRWQQVTSSHIHVLWQTYQRCSEHGSGMRLTGSSDGLIRVLKVLDLYDILTGAMDRTEVDVRTAVRIDLAHGSSDYADEFTTKPSEVDGAIKSFVDFLKGMELPEVTQFELRTLFYEVVTNIRCHSDLPEGSLVVFICRADESRISMVFADSGQPFDPTESTADVDVLAAAKDRRTRGFGIMMIRKMADSVSYVRKDDSVNVLTLEKGWDSKK